ncbi:acetate--CoA ligase family protein, partial [Methanocrinis sp.]|uniref:acetate--CoA ligase family protein n=1 Tax=Methanocrinis sp. TaxID=3101522 RepID=UPI003D0E0238
MAELFREVLGRAKEENRSYLMEHECKAILESLSISTTGAQVARSEEEAVQMAESIGYPVVLKVVSPEVVHKSDAGGVKLDLKSPDEVRRAYAEIREAFREKGLVGVAVQEMAPAGTEAIVGVARDHTFGPILMFGLGGIFVEILQDVSLRSIPISESDAEEMIAGIKGHALLEGYRGRSADITALKGLLMQISDLVVKYPEIA